MSKSFNLKNEIEKYTSKLTANIISPRIKKQVKQEYADHIEDSVYRYTLQGLGEKEALIKACGDMGDVNKVKFLLSEIHNNKLQIFITNKIKKLRNCFASKAFYKTVIITFVIFAAAIFGISYSSVIRETVNDFIRFFILLFVDKEVQLRLLGFVIFAICFFILICFIKVIIFSLSYILERLIYYIHIIIFCLFKKCKLRISRVPFSSLRGLNKKGDLKIVVGKQSYIVHFIDVILKYRREFIVLDDTTYAVTEVIPDELRTYGATIVDGRSWYNIYRSAIKSSTRGKDWIKKFPNIDDSSEKHIIIVHSNPISKTVIRKNTLVSLGEGDTFGNFINHSFKGFIRFLKRISQ